MKGKSMSEPSVVPECWVWAAIDPDTDELSVLGIEQGGQHLPLIALDEESAKNNTLLAHVIHGEKIDSPTIHHFHFTNCEELEIVQ
jgi:hypothetical protein